jgi:hypothetical protein
VDDDVGEIWDLVAQFVLELARKLVGIKQGGLWIELEREEDDAPGSGAEQPYRSWLGAGPLRDDALDLSRKLEPAGRIERTGYQWALQWLQVCLHFAHVGSSANVLLDVIGDRER